ncbi:hypothetical protein L596_003644 [Steinernema carpocapsae]|uniref:Fringe-like glycosyltransferase domain-containing protein n=1 Tax=Steinernema carpocapsae TaxID=34508 RepID=A0A4U8UUA3_STECR|nr:hypothetical protein L596_003644 [Steinernema carpocapsae]
MEVTVILSVLLWFAAHFRFSEGYGRVVRDVRLQSKDSNRLTITVKTTSKFHESRARDIADTWFQLAPENIFFFTDSFDDKLNKSLGGHLINTGCGKGHSRDRLNCKTNAELDLFTQRLSDWACHFDDDNYVNVKTLLNVLDLYDHNQDWYIGKSSTQRPVELDTKNGKVTFWFATGGAGICLSRALVRKMTKYVANGGFAKMGSYLSLPDDMLLGYLISHKLSVSLTTDNRFHSHFEDLALIDRFELAEQVSLSAGSYDKQVHNLVDVPVAFSTEIDKQRFRSLHCFLFSKRCPDIV